MVFFRKYLSEAVRDSVDAAPMLAPKMLTENDFFSAVSALRTTDRITLLMELYDCYKELNPKAETLDEFIFWGDVLIGDFNDVDKYLVDPHRLYTNVSDFKSIQDDFSHLTDLQRETIEKFLGHFVGVPKEQKGDKSTVKQNFMQIWNILEPLYESFGRRLREMGCAYEGMVYRSFARRLENESVVDVLSEAFPGVEKFVFVGLNALNECEKTVMRRMRDASLAEFCWDYCGPLIRDKQNKSSFFMESNVRDFPQAFALEDLGDRTPNINVVSVPSAVGQVKVVPELLREDGPEPEFLRGGGPDAAPQGASRSWRKDCAIVLPDEGLLMPLLNTIPPEIKEINVTMGYSMASSALYALMSDIASLQLNLRQRGQTWCFYFRPVWAIFSSGVFTRLADDECRKKVGEIKNAGNVYIPEEDFKGHKLLELIFRPIIKKPKDTDGEQIRNFAKYQMEVASALGAAMSVDGDMVVETEFAKSWYCEINKLAAKNLEVLPSTWIKLVDGMLGSVSVPFRGEPLRGLQIMGPLEIRALDFRNLIILSSNEGKFPSRSVSSSFIPPELRRAFNLPTYEYQDAVWAYYFYRMIARAENVWMVYDSRTEGLNTGEESRYIKQLALHFHRPIRRYVAVSGIGAQSNVQEIVKTQEDVDKIKETWMSATTLQSYLACPAQFYYAKVKGLSAEEEISETLDGKLIGTIYHSTMQALFSGEEAMKSEGEFPPLKEVSADYLRSWLKREKNIKEKVYRLIIKELRLIDVSGRNLVVAEVIVRYVLQTIRKDLDLLSSHGKDRFRIGGLELKCVGEFHGFNFIGFVDRLDSIEQGEVRVSDYKTGKVLDNDLHITDDNAENVVTAVFGNDNSKRPKIALQIFVYDMLLRNADVRKRLTDNMLLKDIEAGGQITNSVYQTASLFTSAVEEIRLSEKFYELMETELMRLLDKMTDLNEPFSRTEDSEVCKWCDFKMICGR